MGRFATLLLAVPTCVGQTFDFSAVAPSGQRLYYSYDGGVGNSVKVVNPGYGEDYASPTGALVIPESVRFEDEDYVVRAIGAQAFNGCEGLTSVEMGNSITSVERAFDGCSNLIRIVFSDSVSTISSNVLVPSLKSVTFGALFVSVSEAMFIPTSNALVLDTLRYRSDLCISQLQKWSRLNKTSSNTYVPLKALIVPCGYLQDFYNAGWNQLGSLRTECSDITIAIQIESLSENPELEKGNIHRIAPGTSYSRLGDRSIVIGDTMYCERDKDVTLYYARGAFSAGDPIVDHWSDLSTGDSLRFTATNETESITLYVTSKPYATLDVNNISAPVDIYGGMGYMEYLGQYRFKDTAATIYSTGLWVAGMNGEWLHTATNRFGEDGRDYKAGPISDQHIGNVGEGFFWNHVWKVSREDIDNHLADCANGSYDASSNREIATWPGPFVDVDNDGSYTPSQGDYPLIKGDEALLTIFNDKISHRESKGNALGIDVQLMVYAFNEPYYDNENALNNTVFAEYLIINRSNNIYTDCYLGSFTDFDLGWARDDYIGTDVTRQMSYCYNGEDIDGPGTGSFSGVPPAQSCVMLKGANELGMTGSLFYNNSIQGDNGTPLKATDYYNYLQGKWQNGHHMLYGGDASRIGVIEGLECDFITPGPATPNILGPTA